MANGDRLKICPLGTLNDRDRIICSWTTSVYRFQSEGGMVFSAYVAIKPLGEETHRPYLQYTK